ncbi:MAG: DUF6291 domain-containing protein, partial [Limisphaerales bacterium]
MSETETPPPEGHESFVFYRSFYEPTRALPDEMRLAVLDSVIQFALDGTEPTGDPVVLAMFGMVRPQIEANNKRRRAGKRGGDAKASNRKQTLADSSNDVASPSNDVASPSNDVASPSTNVASPSSGVANVNVNVNGNVNGNGNGNGNNTPQTPEGDLATDNGTKPTKPVDQAAVARKREYTREFNDDFWPGVKFKDSKGDALKAWVKMRTE